MKKIIWPLGLLDIVYDISMDLGRDGHFFNSKKIYRRLIELPFFQEEIKPLLDNKKQEGYNKYERFYKRVSIDNAINYRLKIMEKRKIIEGIRINRLYSIVENQNN